MSILSRWLLIPPVSARLSERYQGYRRHGAPAFSAALGCFWAVLAWVFIPLEHPRWQRIRAGSGSALRIRRFTRISTPLVRAR